MATSGVQRVVAPFTERIALATLRTVEVFGSTDAAAAWLNEPLPVLNNNNPMSLLAAAEFDRFEDLLAAIEHGIFA